MTSVSVALRAAFAVACALALGGCISLLPKSDPVQLYRFEGVTAEAAAPSIAAAPQVAIFKAPSNFLRSASGDRILTIAGGHAAYVADARWVSPAAVLFDEALMRAFDRGGGAVRLVSRGEPARTQYSIRLDVRDFHALYDQGQKAAPEVVVTVRASLIRGADQSLAGQRILEARVRAGDNRVGAIVAAFDSAVGQVLADLVAWTTATAAPTA